MGYFILGIWVMLTVGLWVFSLNDISDGDDVKIITFTTVLIVITAFFIGVHLGELGVLKN